MLDLEASANQLRAGRASGFFDGAMMHLTSLPPPYLLDEAEPPGAVEPLPLAGGHPLQPIAAPARRELQSYMMIGPAQPPSRRPAGHETARNTARPWQRPSASRAASRFGFVAAQDVAANPGNVELEQH